MDSHSKGRPPPPSSNQCRRIANLPPRKASMPEPLQNKDIDGRVSCRQPYLMLNQRNSIAQPFGWKLRKRAAVMNVEPATSVLPPSVHRGHFRLFLAPLLLILLLDLLFHDRIALSSHTGSQLIRSISTVANHLRAFCAGLPSGLRCPARTRNGRS